MSAVRTPRGAALRALAAVAALIALVGLVLLAASDQWASAAKPAAKPATSQHSAPKPTIVLVHGAWADASGWGAVIERLQKKGYRVIAPANPLRSLSGDSAYVASILAQTPGPIVLVGHSYGGAVITNAAAGNANVKALVYIAGFIPDVGEDTLHLAGEGSLIADSIEFKAFPPFGASDVDAYIKQDVFHDVFAADLPERDAAVMAAAQRPVALAAGGEPSRAAAWKTIPSWALIPLQDLVITPAAHRFMTERAGSTVVEVDASHVAMISKPRATTRLIERAVRATR
jgi:pimeloyl-ACP methyl ester carboxylesterase